MEKAFLKMPVARAIGIVACIALFIGAGVFAYALYAPVTRDMPAPASDATANESPAAPPTFAWRFAEADSLNPDGNPETDVFLDVTYADGSSEARLIDTSHGSCGELEDSEGGIAGSTSIQCYGAGLGYRYRITRGERAYVVERKTFEEGLPDYEPPAYAYEAIVEIPFAAGERR